MMFTMTAVRSPHGASISLMSKNQTVILFFISRGFHALKLSARNKLHNRSNGESRHNPNPYFVVRQDGQRACSNSARQRLVRLLRLRSD